MGVLFAAIALLFATAWTLPASDQSVQHFLNQLRVPRAVQATCTPQCENNGVCISTNRCQCPNSFSGPQCQNDNTPCLKRPPSPYNSLVACHSEPNGPRSCQIKCLGGYTFPDGTTQVEVSCADGSWTIARADWESVPDCDPTCTPSCQNGGRCTGVNVCTCTREWRGRQCQYSADICSPQKLGFDGYADCADDGEVVSCSFRCDEGYQFEFPPSSVYKCLYSTGVFTPQAVPKCKRSCSNGRVYSSCGPSQPPTCGSDQTTKGVVAPVKCVEGCFCPSGLVEYNDACIKEEECPCEREGKMYKPGQTVSLPDDCNQCVCKKGKWECTQRDCSVRCGAYGDPHYTTFDGRKYDFMGLCTYTFLQTDEYTIDGENVACPKVPTCTKSVTIKAFDEYIINLKQGKKVTVNGLEVTRLPYEFDRGIIKEASSLQVVVEFTDGLKVWWDGQTWVQIEVPVSFKGRTRGLCGTYNSNPGDDFTTRRGVVETDVNRFANTWKTDLDCGKPPPPPSPCENNVQKKEMAEKHCRIIKSDLFANCHPYVNPDTYYEACLYDMCACEDEVSKCLCTTLAAYGDKCAATSSFACVSWRDSVPECRISCRGNQVYQLCGDSCTRSCRNIALNPKCRSRCIEGCNCPQGQSLDGHGKCVPISNCPCLQGGQEFPPGHKEIKVTSQRQELCTCVNGLWKCQEATCELKGKVYKPGQTVSQDACNTCLCDKGKWVCTKKSCSARCTAYGDPHYTTFDGRKYDFMGLCTYTLLQTDDYTIDGENVACPKVPTCTKSLTIRTSDGYTINLNQGKKVIVNGLEVTHLPYEFDRGIIKEASSLYVVVEFIDGLVVWWDGQFTVHIDVPASFKGQTQGLCGTFNSNPGDDFTTREGDVETDVVRFANTWKTDLDCGSPPPLFSPCERNMQKRQMADKHCRIITSNHFAKCHPYVNPAAYYEACLYDMCACEDEVSKCLCPTLAVYGDKCAAASPNARVSWRESVPECRISCRGNQVYQVCGDSCTRSCRNIALNPNCKSRCIEGCNCPEGQTLDGHGKCVRISNCPCLKGGHEFPAGHKEIRVTPHGQELCTCVDAVWKCQEATCEHRGRVFKPGQTVSKDSCNTCLCDKGKWVCTKKYCGARCTAFGDPHYTTFDGRKYDFMGLCTYVLLKTDNYIIEGENVACPKVPTCTKSVTISTSDDYVINLKQGRKVFVDGIEITHLPYEFDRGIIKQASSLYVVVEFIDGLQVWWDGQFTVHIDVPASFRGRTKGLCGTFNSNPYDDFTTRRGVVETDVVRFASTWKTDEKCGNPPPTPRPCENNVQKKEMAEKHCRIIKSNHFAKCHRYVNPDTYYEACLYDMCACEDDVSKCLCPTLAVYGDKCAAASPNARVSWRDSVPECRITCRGNQVYQVCGDSCTRSCRNIALNPKCRSRCIEGCNCPEGQALNEHGKCVRISNCPCLKGGHEFPAGHKEIRVTPHRQELCACVNAVWKCQEATCEHKGTVYKPGQTVYQDSCNTCLCDKGKWVCTKKSCAATTVRCSAYGDPHYTTFDGRSYDFMGLCTYTLLQTDNYIIDGENVACPKVPTCTKSVTIRAFDEYIINLKQGRKVFVNGLEVKHLPYEFDRGIIKEASSLQVVVEFTDGLQVWWDGQTWVQIDVPASFKGQTQGLCGTYNSNPGDDFTTRDGDIETDVIRFANTWKTDERCGNPPPTPRPCENNVQKKEMAEKHCRIITSNHFAKCHPYVNPAAYYEACLYDMCACGDEVSKCLCTTLAAYGDKCAATSPNAMVSWRDSVPECRITCPGNQVYQVCGDSCTRSCRNIALNPKCSSRCVEGCNCPQGQALDKNGKCVLISNCPCLHGGYEFPPGHTEIRVKPDRQEVCTCVNAAWKCRPFDDSSIGHCTKPNKEPWPVQPINQLTVTVEMQCKNGMVFKTIFVPGQNQCLR